MKKLFLLLPIFVLVGCSTTPTWTKATLEQHANLNFTYDEAYFNSAQFTNDANQSVDTVIRLKKQLAE